MSTIGASAAGLGRFPSMLSSYSAEGTPPASRSSPSDSSRGTDSRQSPPTPNGTTSLETARERLRSASGVSHDADLMHQEQNTRPAPYDAKQSYEEQSARIAELVERFEETAAQISRFVQATDITDPPGPGELQRRLIEHLVSDVTEVHAPVSSRLRENTSSSPSRPTTSSRPSRQRPSLNVVL